MRTSWKEERRYPDANDEVWVIVHKRLDYEGKVKTKTDRLKMSKPAANGLDKPGKAPTRFELVYEALQASA